MPPDFNLQSVLDYRKSLVDLLEIKLGGLNRTYSAIELFLQDLIDGRTVLFGNLRGKQMSGNLDVSAIQHLQQTIKAFNRQIVQQQNTLEDLLSRIEILRMEMVVAKQDEQALDKLREKAQEQHRQEQKRQEQLLQDDIYIVMAYQNSNNVLR